MKSIEELNKSGGVRPVLDTLKVTHSFLDDMEEHWGFRWSVDSEIGKLRAALMRRPGREVELAMEDPLQFSMLDKLNPEGMREEFDTIKRIYEDNGVKVYLLDDEDVPEDCPNILYCRDLVNGSPNGAIINRMGINVRSKEVVAAAKAAYIHPFIMRLPLGYDTVISEDGGNISKGQKQLLTIARAMLYDARMLILDEATSNVDTSTERKIQKAMRELMKDKTCFVIAHRLSTIQNADYILVVDKGDIVEQGNHESLMERKGFYYKLYVAQFE